MAWQARLGWAWQGGAGRGLAGHGKAGPGEARQARLGWARPGEARRGLAWREAGDLLQTDTLNTAGVWEQRASVTLNFGVMQTTEQQINTIDSAEVGLSHDGETVTTETTDIG